MKQILLAAIAALLPLSALAQTAQELTKGASDTRNVLNYGMGYHLQRFSPIDQINKDNVKDLVPLWNYSYDDNRSEESQPLVYNGVLYVTTNSATMAIDAKTGKQIWKTKVDYPPETPRIVCCGIINRGAALFDGKLYRTTLDANVVALDAKTGKEVWKQNAIDFKTGYSMTGAPLVADGVILTGVSGAEFGTRLFIDGWDRADRPASLAHLHDPGTGRARQRDMAGRHLAAWRRLDLDHRLVRSRAAHGLLGHRQSRAVQRRGSQGRQPLYRLGPGARSEDRQDQMALPVLAQ